MFCHRPSADNPLRRHDRQPPCDFAGVRHLRSPQDCRRGRRQRPTPCRCSCNACACRNGNHTSPTCECCRLEPPARVRQLARICLWAIGHQGEQTRLRAGHDPWVKLVLQAVIGKKLTNEQMAKLAPSFPKSHGKPWVDHQRILSIIISINRNGLRWRDAPRSLLSAQNPIQMM